MRKYFAKGFIFFLLLAFVGTSCTASRGKGKIKRGRPIPCPVKDC